MALMEQIENDYKEAFKAHQGPKVSMLRMLKSSLKNAEIEARHNLSDEEIITVMTKEAKRRRESISMFQQAGRTELVEQENAELQELMYYLPTQMSDAEIEALATSVIAELNATTKDFGRVMKTVTEKSKGQADGSRIAPIVKTLLK